MRDGDICESSNWKAIHHNFVTHSDTHSISDLICWNDCLSQSHGVEMLFTSSHCCAMLYVHLHVPTTAQIFLEGTECRKPRREDTRYDVLILMTKAIKLSGLVCVNHVKLPSNLYADQSFMRKRWKFNQINSDLSLRFSSSLLDPPSYAWWIFMRIFSHSQRSVQQWQWEKSWQFCFSQLAAAAKEKNVVESLEGMKWWLATERSSDSNSIIFRNKLFQIYSTNRARTHTHVTVEKSIKLGGVEILSYEKTFNVNGSSCVSSDIET